MRTLGLFILLLISVLLEYNAAIKQGRTQSFRGSIQSAIPNRPTSALRQTVSLPRKPQTLPVKRGPSRFSKISDLKKFISERKSSSSSNAGPTKKKEERKEIKSLSDVRQYILDKKSSSSNAGPTKKKEERKEIKSLSDVRQYILDKKSKVLNEAGQLCRSKRSSTGKRQCKPISKGGQKKTKEDTQQDNDKERRQEVPPRIRERVEAYLKKHKNVDPNTNREFEFMPKDKNFISRFTFEIQELRKEKKGKGEKKLTDKEIGELATYRAEKDIGSQVSTVFIADGKIVAATSRKAEIELPSGKVNAHAEMVALSKLKQGESGYKKVNDLHIEVSRSPCHGCQASLSAFMETQINRASKNNPFRFQFSFYKLYDGEKSSNGEKTVKTDTSYIQQAFNVSKFNNKYRKIDNSNFKFEYIDEFREKDSDQEKEKIISGILHLKEPKNQKTEELIKQLGDFENSIIKKGKEIVGKMGEKEGLIKEKETEERKTKFFAHKTPEEQEKINNSILHLNQSIISKENEIKRKEKEKYQFMAQRDHMFEQVKRRIEGEEKILYNHSI